MRELIEREEGKMAIITFVIFMRFYQAADPLSGLFYPLSVFLASGIDLLYLSMGLDHLMMMVMVMIVQIQVRGRGRYVGARLQIGH